MAGYVFTLNNIDSLQYAGEKGIYSTNFKSINNYWSKAQEGTFADFYSMRPGDNVYFFHKRMVYGIGEIKEINESCIFLNFPHADLPIKLEYKNIKKEMIIKDSPENIKNRILCTFTGAPSIFKKGVDMDEVLGSNPEAFRMLRALWKLSFIKIDDAENKALFDIILKNNHSNMNDPSMKYHMDDSIHKSIAKKDVKKYKVDSLNMLSVARSGSDITHEMAIEATIIDYISRDTENNIFGHWDYISHQVIASPFKPIDYMDKMDIFGYRFIENYKTISEYLLIEVKKDRAEESVINQAMKYVDWIEKEYSHDYSMIEAYIVAKDFDEDIIKSCKEKAKRYYTKGRNPAQSFIWNNLKLIKYQYNEETKLIVFTEIDYKIDFISEKTTG
ncbi:hypothetical protein [Macrococcus brunensis]|uniref:hypothetical protein n=1 Tax=Macrococcus brunensis TaxID=198483 RepID=UPI001EF11B65|nr:hypothetical protein [Macrococcus brunensis]ULG71390.1 hypothetical protein MGG12_08580 [Macrococcus brunensis]